LAKKDGYKTIYKNKKVEVLEKVNKNEREILILKDGKFLAHLMKIKNNTVRLKVSEKYEGIREVKKKVWQGIDRFL